jgi:AhpD family alkylhydroperoxidase
MPSSKQWYIEASPEPGSAFRKFHDSVTNESSLDKKTVELIKVAVSSVLRCRHCTEDHIVKAMQQGVSREAIAGAMMVASLQCAGTQLYWANDIFEKHLGDKKP